MVKVQKKKKVSEPGRCQLVGGGRGEHGAKAEDHGVASQRCLATRGWLLAVFYYNAALSRTLAVATSPRVISQRRRFFEGS